MSHTRKDGDVHGIPAAGQGRKNRACGAEFWGKRSALSGLRDPGKYTKKQTHRAERRQGKRETEE